MPKQRSMSSPWKTQPEAVADKVLKRAEISKMARRIQNSLALAQFKTKHGWEDLTLDTIEPKVEEEMRRKRLSEGDVLSDSSSSASDLPYPRRTLMSSPMKAPFFSDAVGSSNGSTGHRKRTYASFDHHTLSSPSKRFRGSPTAHRSFNSANGAPSSWKEHHQLAQSSPIKPRRQQHFTTSTGPDVSFFAGSRRQMVADALSSPNYAAVSHSDDDDDDDDDDLLPAHSFRASARGSPPSTPPPRSRRGPKNSLEDGAVAADGVDGVGKTAGEEGADLLLYLAASPSPAVRTRMEPPSTPPPPGVRGVGGPRDKLTALPSTVMTTPGGGNPFPNTPGGLAFDFSDFVHMTPSPMQKPWKTPVPGSAAGRTPLSLARRRLTFDDIVP